MAFFGLDQKDLEQDKRDFLQGGLDDDVAVYTWGEESYDGLADALQEGGDDKNDETFGDVGTVGKDFDFGHPQGITSQPSALHHVAATAASIPQHLEVSKEREKETLNEMLQQSSLRSKQLSRPPAQSLEAIWDDDSSFSIFPRTNESTQSIASSASIASKFNHLAGNSTSSSQSAINYGNQASGIRTLEEIEAEMRTSRGRQAEMMRQEEQRMRDHEQQVHLQRLQNQQEQQLQLQRLREHQLQQQQHLPERTPPPRMLPITQSPRFQDQERMQFLQAQQEQAHLLELQEQARVEELERQFRVQQISQLNQGPSHYPRQPPSLLDIQTEQALLQQRELHRRQQSQSPAFGDLQYQNGQTQQNMQYLPQNIHQQRLLAELAQNEYLRELQASNPAEQEMLRMEAMRKIVEAEKMEGKRRRKAGKIAHMARYNDLMTQSDKDFITRIQVSQLVTQDPYAEDFYAQVYTSQLRMRVGMDGPDRVLKFGSGGGVGLGIAQKGGNRRPSAMQRMEAQVERIVSNARQREKEKGLHSLHSLQGALGKTSGRSYKASPRQLLQVDASNVSPTSPPLAAAQAKGESSAGPIDEAAIESAKLNNVAVAGATLDGPPLTHREVLVALEMLHDLMMRLDHLLRTKPHLEDEEDIHLEWSAEYHDVWKQIWDGIRVLAPMSTSDPHPFISLITPVKGKKLLSRFMRTMDEDKLLTMTTLILACFRQLDVVRNASILDSADYTLEREDAERQMQAFSNQLLPAFASVILGAEFPLVSGLLELFLQHNFGSIPVILESAAGLSILSVFLDRAHTTLTSDVEVKTPEQEAGWKVQFDHLFELITPHLNRLFPSTRIAPAPTGATTLATDALDQPAWLFLAGIAMNASPGQHRILVEVLREKVLETVHAANKGWVADEEERRIKLAPLNVFLNAMFLDSSQIVV